MKKVKINFTVLTILFCTTFGIAQVKPNILIGDFKNLIGSWEGTLTYLDYSSGKPYTMSANVEIKRIGKSNKFIFSNKYPNETSANSSDTLSISLQGKHIGTELVISRKILKNNEIEIITEENGIDGNDNKAATFRHTYIINKSTFRKRKDVQFKGEREWINRHEYSYKIITGK